MLTHTRKTFDSILESGLKKCKKMYSDAVYVECTPAEYFALCEYFDCKFQDDYDLMIDKLKNGECTTSSHHLRVKQIDHFYLKNKYQIEDCVS